MNPQSGDTIESWKERLARFNNWTPAEKALLSYCVLLPGHLAYKLAAVLLIGDAFTFTWLFWLGVGILLSGTLLCLFYIRIGSNSQLPMLFGLYLYAGWCITVVQQTGLLDSVYAQLFPTTVISFAVFAGWRYGMHILGIWFVAILGLGVCQHLGWLAYGSAYALPMEEIRSSTAWLVLNALFMLMVAAITLLFLWLVLQARDKAMAGMERSQGYIRRYLPPAVADQIIAGKEAEISTPQRRRVTVLFSDIVGFTDMADRVEPEVMTQVIGDYMAAMSQIVDEHQGTVNEFIGDGLMALFGAPTELEPEQQAKQAVLSAQAMLAKLPELNNRWRKLGLGKELQIRIGINTGMSSVGSYGSEGRMTYTAIGLQTNIAARIQSKCAPGRILMSDATYQLIDDVIDCIPKGEVECKGVHYPVNVYAPVGGG